MPAALLEIGFLSNPQEEQLLNNPAFQQKMALAIVAGIDQFFGQAAKMRGELMMKHRWLLIMVVGLLMTILLTGCTADMGGNALSGSSAATTVKKPVEPEKPAKVDTIPVKIFLVRMTPSILSQKYISFKTIRS